MDCTVVQEGARMIAQCPEETFGELVRSLPHWKLELLIGGIETVIVDVMVGALAWPFLRKWWARHHSHDKCDPKGA